MVRGGDMGYAWKERYCTGTVEATHEQVLCRYCRREGREKGCSLVGVLPRPAICCMRKGMVGLRWLEIEIEIEIEMGA